jgi:hypothetical protein
MLEGKPLFRILSLAASVCIGGSAPATGQAATGPPSQAPDQEAILTVVDSFMHAISTNDAALMARLRLEGGASIVERPAAAGGTVVTRRTFTPDGMKPGMYRERYWDPIVHVRGKLAVVWTPYEFWQNGKTSHCGIDVFDLVKEEGAWRIANTMWTVEPDACPALRPSDPGRMRPKP